MTGTLKLLFFFILFAADCSPDENKYDSLQEIKKIRAADRALLMAETRRDLAGAMQHLAEGAILHPPDAPPVIGTDAIRDFYRNWFKLPYAGIHCESDTIVISSAGDFACVIGNSYMKFESPAGTYRVSGKYTSIWQKIDENWLCIAVSWSGNAPPAAAAENIKQEILENTVEKYA